VENHCPTAQSFRIESQGLPASLLKTSGSVSIGGGASTDFPIKLNTVGLAPGTYSGNIVVICVTCGDTCKQDRSIFPIQFSVAAGSNK
jgi:preprotein translocase subunit SecY